MADPNLIVRDLTITRGGVAVLEHLEFQVRAGEALVLRGPNGIGKTTLLRTIAGLQPPSAGEVIAPEESMAYAGHSDGLKTALTVVENLRFWADVFGAPAACALVDKALEAFDLTALQERPAGALSAGQKRRLGLARMMVTGRPIWIFDEPTVSLDQSSVALFADAVRAHLAGGGVAIMATHIDLGLEARVLDVGAYRATAQAHDAFGGDFDSFDEGLL